MSTPDDTAARGTFPRRVAAWFLDFMLVVSIVWLSQVVLQVDERAAAQNDAVVVVWNVALVLIAWIYWARLESSPRQATLGKQAMGLVVTDLEGRRLSFGRATLRFALTALTVLTLGVGYVMAAVTPRRQALHDMIAGALVRRAVRV